MSTIIHPNACVIPNFASNSDILDNSHSILRIWKFDKFRNHINNNGTTHFFYNSD